MDPVKYVSEKINLTTLTPIFIGDDNGSDLSPVTDFVANGNKINLIDQKKFENLLNKDLSLIDEFVTEVKGNSKNFDLKSFIENRLNSSVSELSKKIINVEGYLQNNSVKPFISSLGKPFIPGSTIKGAIRTAVIYNYLISNERGKNIVDELFDPTLRIKELESKYKLSKSEGKNLKNLISLVQNKERNKSDYSNNWGYSVIYNELNIFKSKDFGHDFRHFQVSDSPLLDVDRTIIIRLLVEYLIKDDNKTPVWKQVLNENTFTNFNLKIDKDFKDYFLSPLNTEPYKEIFKMINKFSLDIIKFELDRFNEYIENGKQDKDKLVQKLSGIIEFYNSLKEKIKFGRNSFAVIRIGGGKTYFDNSIGLALYNADKDKFKQFRKLLGFWKHRSGNRGFVEEDSPITRTFYYDKYTGQHLPIGWIVIYFGKDKQDVYKLFTLDAKQSTDMINVKNNSVTNNANSDELDLSKLSNLGRVIIKKN